jgi:DNA-binding transcriptional regulator GbsR (MarR family)
MTDTAKQVTENLVEALGRLAESAGFNRMIGQIYALLYLNPERLSLGEIAEKLGVSKGSASLNTTSMERWGMIKRHNLPADRRDFYEADTDFWEVLKRIMRNREKKLITDLRNSVAESLKDLKKANDTEARFKAERLKHLMDFLNTSTRLFNAYMALERFNFSGLKITGSKDENSE